MKKKVMQIHDTLGFLKLGLISYKPHPNSIQSHKINSVDYINHNTIVVTYTTSKLDRLDIRSEMAELMSFTASFYLLPDEKSEMEIPKSISIKAQNANKDQLMYVVSSIETAQYITKGRPIEWIKNSMFEDTTDEFLLQNAKRLISKIENALRELIYTVLYNASQKDWILKIETNIYKSALKQYKKNTDIAVQDIKSKDILSYTYLPNLKKIIEDNGISFSKHFTSLVEFTNNMTELNQIRRDESHNRKISKEQSESLQKLYDFFLMNISKTLPNLVPDYIIENWHIQLKLIVDNLIESIPNINDSDRRNFPIVIIAFIKYQKSVELACSKISKVLVPVNKQHLHSQLSSLLNSINSVLKSMLEMLKSGLLDDFQNKFTEHKNLLNKLSKFGETYLFNEA
ncbi:MAG: hypothetical protein HQ534_08390 [Armatimonadetes bacterium]|nr:hypothetical protein [Armatimonadota bacterium]